MRIFLVNSFFPPWRGGAETYTYNLAKQLVHREHSVDVFCTAPPRKPGTYSVDGIRLHCLPVTAWLYGTPIAAELPRRLVRIRADLIHAGFPSPYNAFTTSFASRVRDTSSVLTWHNDLPAVTAASKPLVFTHDNLVLPTYVGAFDRIISTSSRYAQSSRILRRYERKVAIVPNGVDCNRFYPDIDPSTIRGRFNLRDEKVVLFVGALSKWHSYKGLDVLIKAFASFNRRRRDTVLLVVGDGSMRRTYEGLASDLGLMEKVMFAGAISNQDLSSFYAASDILVLPSRNRSEGFGLTILEANACGKPAIGSNVGGIPDVIRHGFNGLLFPPDDPEALCRAIGLLVDDDGMRETMGKNGRMFAEERDWSKVAEATERVYFEAMASSAPD